MTVNTRQEGKSRLHFFLTNNKTLLILDERANISAYLCLRGVS